MSDTKTEKRPDEDWERLLRNWKYLTEWQKFKVTVKVRFYAFLHTLKAW